MRSHFSAPNSWNHALVRPCRFQLNIWFLNCGMVQRGWSNFEPMRSEDSNPLKRAQMHMQSALKESFPIHIFMRMVNLKKPLTLSILVLTFGIFQFTLEVLTIKVAQL